MKNHTTRTVPINARRVDLLAHKRGKKVTNRCRSALVQSVLSSLVLVQGARARALWRLSGHTLLSREMRERVVSCSLPGGRTQQWRDLQGL